MKFELKKPRPLFIRIILWGLPALLILFIGGFFYLRSWLGSYLQSEPFRQWLGRLTSRQLDARCEYEPFHFSGLTVNAEAFKALGAQKALFSKLELDKIRTGINLSGLWRRTLEVDEVDVEHFQISLGHTASPPVPEGDIGTDPDPAKTPPTQSNFVWLKPILDLRRVIVHQADVLWGENTPQTGSMTGAEVTVTPDGDAWNVLVQGGTVSQKGGPDLKLDHVKMHYQNPIVDLSEGLLVFPPGGNIGLSGEVNTQKSIDVQVKVNSIPLKPFLPPDLQSKLQGVVFADVKVSGAMPVENLPDVAGTGHLENADVEGIAENIPFVNLIEKLTHSQRFNRIKLNTASADFAYAGEKVTVTNLFVESKGLVCIQGGFVVSNSRINGNFQVGIPHDFLILFPILETQVFTRSQYGYQWAPVHVSGPLSSPQEDLLHRIEMAVPNAVLGAVKDLEKVPNAPEKAIHGLFKEFHK